MGWLAKIKSFVGGDKLDVRARYELLREAVTGTMSTFHMARDRESGDVVGLKILDEEKTSVFEERFKGLDKPSEGEIACAIEDPRVVRSFRHGTTTEGKSYIICEYLPGNVLSSLILTQDPVLEGKRARLILQMAEAIGAVHEAGFIHRDICPRNFICAPDATSLKLIDFGLTLPARKEFMQPGNRTGTPNYLAPEVVRRKTTDHRVDIFALGVTAYHLCTFQLPWPSQEATGKAALKHDTLPATDVREHQPQLNERLATAIMQCIEVDVDKRPQSAAHVARLLRGIEHELGEA